MKKRIIIIEESLNEFAKRGRPRKAWNDTEEDDEVVDDIDVDVSDMTDTDKIEIEDNVYDSELLKALSNELKVPEFSRRTVKFRLKGDLDRVLRGIPMAKMVGKPGFPDAFYFKLQGGAMKKVLLKDIILEQEKGNDRFLSINEVR